MEKKSEEIVMDELNLYNNILKEDAENKKKYLAMSEYERMEMYLAINKKVGFDVMDKKAWDKFVLSDEEAHERDNVPSPLEELTLEELIFLRYYERTLE